MPITPAVAMLISAGVGGGASLASAKMGSSAAKNVTKTQEQLANDTAARVKPAYDQAYNYYSNLLKGGSSMSQAMAPEVQATNQFFDSSRKTAVEGSYARGGGLDKTLRTNEAGRAFSLANLYGQARPAAATALAGLAGANTAGAAGLLANANQTNLTQQMLQGQALSGLGGIFTRLLSTPGLFGTHASFQLPAAQPNTPAAVIGAPGSLIGSPFPPNNARLGVQE